MNKKGDASEFFQSNLLIPIILILFFFGAVAYFIFTKFFK